MSETSSQSPRALRDSTNDPEEFCKGKVQTSQNDRTPDSANGGAGDLYDNGDDYRNPYA